MSQLDSSSIDASEESRAEPAGILVPKPRTSIYTVLLGVALGALMLGCLFLLLEISDYGPLWSRPWIPGAR